MNLKYLPPDEIYEELFDAVQLNGVFPDSKTFVDCIPKFHPDEIMNFFYREVDKEGFDIKTFVEKYFETPENDQTKTLPEGKTLEEKLHKHWDNLTRKPDEPNPHSSLLELPHSYIVPGGRFREIYYWDSYFTMLGLKASGRKDLIQSMVDNFAYLINTVGHIPNGNRTYFLSRSQPPFFPKMVELLAEMEGDPKVYEQYHSELFMEYIFWMEGEARINLPGKRYKRVVMLDEDSYLSRYWDDEDTPRQESFVEDVELSDQTRRFPDKLFRNLRAACESGWDFSSRWLYHSDDLKSVQTIALIPIDLNVLLSEMERILIKSSEIVGENELALKLTRTRQNRLDAINRYCWNEDQGIFLDFHVKFKEQMDRPSLAMLYPLWAKLASEEQAKQVISFVEKKLFKTGGLVTTTINSGQQWDSPNGWAPLQWIGFEAFLNYGRKDLAMELAKRWTSLNEKVYAETGKMMEKYNVEDLSLKAGGGEYPVQDGFGWTNGVYLAMKNWMKKQ